MINIANNNESQSATHLLGITVLYRGCGDGSWQRGRGPVEVVCSSEVTTLSGQWQWSGHLRRGRVYLGSDAHPQRYDQSWQKTWQSSLKDILIIDNAKVKSDKTISKQTIRLVDWSISWLTGNSSIVIVIVIGFNHFYSKNSKYLLFLCWGLLAFLE